MNTQRTAGFMLTNINKD